MIPYFEFMGVNLGPVQLHSWGLLVGLGMGTALWLGYRRAKHEGLNVDEFLNWCIVMIVGAFIGARLAYVFLYAGSNFLTNPLDAFKVWQGGLSSFGGFAGAAIVAIIYAHAKKINFWQYADAIMFGFPLGLGIGRLGCFINHLHVGVKSNFLLAVVFPDGPRLDMGLIESLFGFVLFIVYLFLEHYRPYKKMYLPLTMIIYGAVRFLFDFGRANDIAGADARYAGLTPAQYGSILLIIGGVIIYYKLIVDKCGKGLERHEKNQPKS